MPWLQRISTEASVQGAEENIRETKARVQAAHGLVPDPEVPFSEVIGTFIGRALDDDEVAYLDAFPSSIRESIRAGVLDALRRDVRIFVQWTPGYDYQADFYEAKSGETSGGLILHVRSPYPRGAASSSS